MGNFGPWAITMNISRHPQLAEFWKRRIRMLGSIQTTERRVRPAKVTSLVGLSLFVLAAPTVLPGTWSRSQSAGAADQPGDASPARAAGPQDRSPSGKPRVRNPLEKARRAYERTDAAIKSAVGSGTFARSIREGGEEEFQLRTKGTVRVFYRTGRYHLKFDHETMLIPTRYTDQETGERVTKRLDWSPDTLSIIDDGDAVYVVTFSKRIRPTGCRGEIYSSMKNACPDADVSWNEPARLWRDALNVGSLLESLGDAVSVRRLSDGRYRGRYRMTNAPDVRAEFDIRPELGFRVDAVRVFNTGDEKPNSTKHLRWKQTDGVWYVNRLVEERTTRGRDGTVKHYRDVLEYTEFRINGEVDPERFKLSNLDIPAGTRFLDRRRDASQSRRYYDGSDLQED